MSELVEIRAPAEQTEGTRSQILRWLKLPGQPVAADEPLIEIETDKVTVEVAAPGSGILREILKQEQEEIGPGELLGRIEAQGSRLGGEARNAADDSGTATARAGDSSAAAASGSASSSAAAAPGPADSRAATSLSPAVRRLLAEHGLETSAVRGTGQGARVTVEDVLRHVSTAGAERSAAATAPQRSPAGTGGSSASSGEAAGFHMVAHSAVRKRIAEHMVHSLLHTAPHVTTVFEANLGPVLAHRERHRAEFDRQGIPLTLTAYFLQAAVAAIRAVPEANSRWTDTALAVYDSVHIGIATALETGLVVPVLRDVQSRDLLETASGLNDLITRAREGRLKPADMREGTFTISNHGVSGSLIATPIVINQPQAAILGIGKLEKRAVVVDDGEAGRSGGRITVQPRCYVTLTIDHRVMDGQQANRFMQALVQRLETSPS
ncbi:MAG TPA: dihydrolipoamide acetyltransferase family protein [Steroidobacteraceae bacterium]|jgi:2-oxoglutarate dehydrogenase E2 component (dihydrolipoamide succinyltransferase)